MPLDFAVAGGGVAGLTAALALGRMGSRIEVFERRPALDDLGAGLQLSPNATRVARSLGVLERLEAVGTQPRALHIRRGRDGGEVAAMPLGTAVRRRYGAPVLVLHRADLLHVLSEAVADLDRVTIAFGTNVDDVDVNGPLRATGPQGPAFVEANALIRADGLAGSRRGGRVARFSGKIAWRALVPSTTLPAVFAEPDTNLWLGDDAHVVHYPVRGGSLVNVVVILEGVPAENRNDVWAETGDVAVLRQRLRHWHGGVRQLIEAQDQWRRWPLFEGATGRPWSNGRELRIGDAAHPMLPFLAQGASQAFEDAAALAIAVQRRPDDPGAAFKAFDEARRPAAERVLRASRRQGQLYHLAGPGAVARDLVMRLLGPDRLLSRMDWLYGPLTA